ncbi:hypothetical protein [Lentzea sp. HUAS12]|uniref:hypothetical protein n=1 Tax=Lentzea sp. HUAS12 TaxID=2951806 RepID=UPI00209D8075|nr:hypothetical protein [Lentzea sp. HUAS12]USX56295.1 hypothetical protein ND450_19990 [Lentzea sp. HUAS12]
MLWNFRKAAVVAVMAAAASTTASSPAFAVGEVVTGVGYASTEGAAYANALNAARNKCSDRNNVGLVSRETWVDPSGWWARISLRCN